MPVFFTSDHEWIDTDGATATVGITLHAQDALGDVALVVFRSHRGEVDEDDVAGVVESVKAAADLYMPAGGEIVEVNEALRDDPSLANSDPQAAGWFFKVRLSDPAETSSLMDKTAYDELVKSL